MKENILRPLRVVAVSGGLQRSSKSTVLAEHLLRAIAEAVHGEVRLVTVGELVPQLAGATFRTQLPPAVEQALAAVECADILIVSTPVFRGSYTGMFKHFFDLIHQDALMDKPVLLAAVGGSQRHALVLEHQLRPLFSFFQARTLPLGIYATECDFADGGLRSAALLERARLAVERALPVIALTCQTTAGAHVEGAMGESAHWIDQVNVRRGAAQYPFLKGTPHV